MLGHRVILIIVGTTSFGDAGITHVGNPPKHHLFTVSGVWVNRRIRSKGKQVQAEPADLSTQTRAASVDLMGLPESGAVVG